MPEKKQRRILFVANLVKLHILEFHVPILQMLKDDGWETTVAAKNDFEVTSDCVIPACDSFFDVPFQRNPLKFENLVAFRMLKEIIKKGHYDLIHCHTPIAAAVTRIAAKCERKRGTKVIYTAHGFHFFNGASFVNWLFYYPIEKHLSKHTDFLITINREDYDRAKKKFFATKTLLVPGVGVDTKKFCPDNEKRCAVRSSLGIEVDTIVLMSVGELNKGKNHIAVVKALGRLSKEKIIPDFRYIIAGQGKEKERIETAAESAGIKDKVILLGYRNDIDSLLQAADIFVFPSKREGLPVSLIEAMASGLPCVASRIRGNIDLIKDTGSNILFELKDKDGIFKALLEMMCKKERGRSEENIKISKQYDISIIKEIMNKIYSDV